MSITRDSTVGKLAAEFPLATRVFARHDIDYCCGGGRPLSDLCAKKGLDVRDVIAEIEKEISVSPFSPERWDTASLDDVITHILVEYHRPLPEELRRLETMACKVLSVHGERIPSVWASWWT